MTIAQFMKRMDARFKTLERRMTSRFDAVDARFDAVDRRFNASDARFGRVDRNLEALGEKLDTIPRTLHGKCDHQQDVADEHEKRLTDLERAAGR
jgi:hypothetical protein